MNILELLRQYRIFDYAIFDFIAAFVGMYFLSSLLSKIFLSFRIEIPRMNWLYLTLPISILIHLLIGRITTMTADFINLYDNYSLKILILVLLIIGFRGIKRIKKEEIKKNK